MLSHISHRTAMPIYNTGTADAPDKPKLIDSDRTFIEVEWVVPYDGGSPITGYIVERKEVSKAKGASSEWAPITRSPTKVNYQLHSINYTYCGYEVS